VATRKHWLITELWHQYIREYFDTHMTEHGASVRRLGNDEDSDVGQAGRWTSQPLASTLRSLGALLPIRNSFIFRDIEHNLPHAEAGACVAMECYAADLICIRLELRGGFGVCREDIIMGNRVIACSTSIMPGRKCLQVLSGICPR